MRRALLIVCVLLTGCAGTPETIRDAGAVQGSGIGDQASEGEAGGRRPQATEDATEAGPAGSAHREVWAERMRQLESLRATFRALGDEDGARQVENEMHMALIERDSMRGRGTW